MPRLLAAIAACLIIAPLAIAEELPRPFEVGGGWASCPVGYLIHEGQCLPAHKGPVTEYGCMEYVCRASGECDARPVAECGAVTAWTGNIGDFGAPIMSYSAPVVGVPAVGFGSVVIISGGR